ncbi:hypothetical protein KM043_014757 [Ampulex compressa]|nr:hypothetical protein KM043_014757 [Ampulex compressa]
MTSEHRRSRKRDCLGNHRPAFDREAQQYRLAREATGGDTSMAALNPHPKFAGSTFIGLTSPKNSPPRASGAAPDLHNVSGRGIRIAYRPRVSLGEKRKPGHFLPRICIIPGQLALKFDRGSFYAPHNPEDEPRDGVARKWEPPMRGR